MATKSFLLKNATASGSNGGSLQDGGTITGAATSTSFEAIESDAAGDGRQIYNTGVSDGSAQGSQLSSAPQNSAEDCWRTINTYTGNFASGTWTLKVAFNISGGGFGDNMALLTRVWHGSNAAGSSPTEITSGTQTSAYQLDNSANGTQWTITFNPGAVSVSGEYIFVQLGFTHQGLGNNVETAGAFTIQVGTAASLLTTPDFVDQTPIPFPNIHV